MQDNEIKKQAEEVKDENNKMDTQVVENSQEEVTSKTEMDKKEDLSQAEEVVVENNNLEKEQEPTVEENSTTQEEVETVDYSTLSKVELVNALNDLLEKKAIQKIKGEADVIKANFYKTHKAEITKLKNAFLEVEGNTEENFEVPEDEQENKFKELFAKYKNLKFVYNENQEKEKQANLKAKYQIIEEIKELINGQESIGKTFNDFRELQNRWREVGLVPQPELKKLWETYHHNVEKFYDFIKINNELRDLDLKKNLEAKIELCEKAEALLLEPKVTAAFKTLQDFHEHWREIGPAPMEKREEIWERFKLATSKINKKHQEFFDNLKVEQENNYQSKVALCEKIEEIAEQVIDKHKGWEEKTKEILEIQKVWRTVGMVSKKHNTAIYIRFKEGCSKFFDQKKEFYKQSKDIQNNNLQLKTDLCVQAESMQDSTDWKKSTFDLINIQKKWKEIGPVPRKQSDEVWKRFRAACDYFFNKKSEYYGSLDDVHAENLNKKKELLKKIEEFKPSENSQENLDQLQELQKEWTEIGHVPFEEKEKLQNQYREVLNSQFDKINIDSDKLSLIRFKAKMENYNASPKSKDKIVDEKTRMINKLSKTESEIILLENNIGFFANSSNAKSLIKDVEVKIDKAKQSVKLLKAKLDILKKLNN